MAARLDSEEAAPGGGPSGASLDSQLTIDLSGVERGAPIALPTGEEADASGGLPADFMLDARYARDGADLVLRDPVGDVGLRLIGYFDGPPAALADSAGRVLQGPLVATLAGPQAPAQLAQAADGAAGGADALLGAPIGEVTETTGTVTIVRADGRTVEAEAGLPVYQDDQVETAPGGAVGMSFEDGSTFSLGTDARVVLDALIYDPGADSSMTLNLVKGSFSFVSGQIAKSGDENMQINTPVATIGVRGTAGAGDENEVILLPEDGPDGQPQLGEISFRTQGGEAILNQPYQGTSANSPFDAPTTPQTFSDTDVSSRFGDALGFLPTEIPANRQLRQERQQREDDDGGGDGGASDGGDAPTDEGGDETADEGGDETADEADPEADPDAEPDAEPEADPEGDPDADQEADPDADQEAAGEGDPDADQEAAAGEGGDDPEGFGATDGSEDQQTQLAAADQDQGLDGEQEPADQQAPDQQQSDDDDDPENLIDDIDFGEEGAQTGEGVDQAAGDGQADGEGPGTGQGAGQSAAQGGGQASAGTSAGTTTAPKTSTSVSGAGGGVSGDSGGGVSGKSGDTATGGGSSGTVAGSSASGESGGSGGGTGSSTTGSAGAALLGDADEDDTLLDEDRDETLDDGDESVIDSPVVVTGSGSADVLTGGGQNDSLDGGGGNDQLFGGAGADNLTGGAGNDVVSGGSGGDTIVGGSGEGDDVYVGGDMTTAGGKVTAIGADDSADDTVIYTSATQGVTVNLGDGSSIFAAHDTTALSDLLGGTLSLAQFGGAYGPQTGVDALTGIEHITSGVGDDTLTGDGAANSITAGDGADFIDGAGSFDREIGSPGADVIDAGAGDDVVVYDTAYASVAGASFDGGTGTDTLRIGAYQAADLSDIAAQASNFEIIELQDSDSSLAVDSASVESLVGGGGTLTVTGSDGVANFDSQIWSATETGEESDGTSYALLTDGTTSVRVTGGVSVPGINLPPSYSSVHGNALVFESSLDQAQGPDALAQSDDVTLEAWIEWDGTFTEANQVVVYNGDAGAGNGFGLALIDTGSGYNVGGLVDGSTVMLSNASVSAETPTHLALVREDGVFTLYVNGQAEPITNPIAAPTTPTSAFAIGGIPLTSALHFTGSIDDVRVWSAARSQAEIDAARSVHLSGSEDGLFAWYPVTTDGALADQTDGSTLTVSGVDFEASSAPVASFAAQEDGSVVLSLGQFIDPDGSGAGPFTGEPDFGQEGGEGGEGLQPPGSSRLTLSVSDGALSVNTSIPGGVGLLSASGGGTSTLVLSASLDEINTTLRSGGISLTPAADMSGQADLTLSFTDDDLTNPKSTSETLTIDVEAVADAPFFSLTPSFSGNPGVPVTLSPLASSPDEDGSETLQLTITGVPAGGSFNAGVDLGGGTVVVDEGDFAALAYTPPVDTLDTATLSFTLTATDGTDTASTIATTSISLSLIDVAFDNDFETGDLLTAENWDGDLVPTAAYNAQIADEQQVSLTSGQSLTLGAMDLGAGTLAMDGGLLRINGALTTEGNGIGTFGAVDLSGGTLALGGGTLAGPFTWTGGVLTGAGTQATSSTLTIEDVGSNQQGALDLSGTVTLESTLRIASGMNHVVQSNARVLGDGVFENAGTLDLGDNITFTAAFENEAGALASMSAGQTGSEVEFLGGGANAGSLSLSGSSTAAGSQSPTVVVGDGESFTNLAGGQIAVSATSISDVVGFRGQFINQGTLDVNGRTRFETGSGVTMSALDNSAGTIDVASGSTLSFANGTTLRLGSLSAMNGAGGIGFDSGTATVALDQDFTWTSNSLAFDVSTARVTISGPGDFVNSGVLTLTAADGDVFDARLVNQSGASILFSNSVDTNQDVEFNGGIDNSGLITLGGGSSAAGSQAVTLSIADGQTLTNQSGATLRAIANSISDVNAIRGDVLNLGTLDVDGQTKIEAVGVSSAVLDTQNGTIDVSSGRTLSVEDGAVLRVGTGTSLIGSGAVALSGSGVVMDLAGDFTWTATSLGLDLTGGSITIGGEGSFTNAGALTLQVDGDVFDTGFVNASGASLTFADISTTGQDLALNQGLLNQGWLGFAGGSANAASQVATLSVAEGQTLTNDTGATIRFQQASISDLHKVRGDLLNLGTLEIAGDAEIEAGSTSQGLLDSENGTITIFSGDTLTIGSKAVLRVGTGTVLDGAGALAFAGTSTQMDLASDFTWTSSTLAMDVTQKAVTIGGTGTFSVAGALTMAADDDRFDVALAVLSGGTLALNNTTDTRPTLGLNDGGTNAGLVVLSGGSNVADTQAPTVVIADGTSFTNLAGGVFRSDHGDQVSDVASVEGTFVNLGTLDVLSALEFDNADTVLDTRDGTVSVAAGDVLRIDDGALMQIGADTVLTGQGTIQFDQASRTLEVVEDFTWTASDLALDLTKTSVTIAGTDTTFTNAGTLTLAVDSDAIAVDFVNASGASLEVTSTGTSTGPDLDITDSFTNAGVMSVTGGSSVAGNQSVTIDVAAGVTFTNAAGGTLSIDHANLPSDHVELRGAYVNDGVVEISGATEIEDLFSNAGVLRIAAGQTLTVDGGTLVNTGTLQGEGTISFINGGAFDNQGTIDVGGGDVGSLTILGDGLDLSDETLILNIANTGSFDQLSVASLDLTGAETLQLSFADPAAAAGTYRLVNYDSHNVANNGLFETITSNLDGDLFDASLVYQADGIDLLVRAKPQIAGVSAVSAREDEGVALTGLSVSDADAGGSEVLTLDLSVDAGTLALSDTAASGVTIVTDNAGSVQLTGTLSQINSFLGGANAVRFNPAEDASGAVTLTVTATDGDGLQSSETQTITVSPVDDGASATLSYLAFDGTDDYLDAGDVDALDVAAGMTIEVRANMTTAPGAGDLATLASKWGAWGERSFWFGVDGTSGKLKLILTADGSTEQSFVSDIGVPTGQWAQYSVSVDPDEDTVTFYFDGQPVGAPQSFTDAGAYTGESRFLIGANEGSGAAPVHHFEGGIAEVRLWSAARSDEEVAQKHNQLLDAQNHEDLAGYWLLNGIEDGAVADRSGHANDAVAQQGPSLDPGAAYLAFDGVDDVVTLPSSASGIRTGTGAFTWEGWIRADAEAIGETNPTLLTIGDAATGERGNLQIDSFGNLAFSSFGQPAATAMSAQSVTTGEWMHVAVAYDGTQVQLYVDGVASGAAQTVSLDISGGAATIGADLDEGRYFTGDLADFRVWSEAKSAADLAAFKDGRLTGDEAGLEGWWPLDEGVDATVFERSGAGYHGTVDGAGWANASGGPPFAPGEAALSLDGVDDQVDLGSDAALFSGTTSFSMEAWVRIEAADLGGGEAQIYSIGTASSDQRADLKIDAAGKLRFAAFGASADAVSSATVADGGWKHVAVVYDAATQEARLYIDGQADGTADFSSAPLDIAAGDALLGRNTTGGNAFTGEIAEARLWGVARSASDIADARLERLSGAEEGLAGYWPLNDGTGTSAANLAPGGSAATLEGGAGWAAPAGTAPSAADSGGPLVGAATADASESEEAGTFYLPEDGVLSGVMASADVEGTPSFALSGETSNDGTFSYRNTALGQAKINLTTGDWTYTPNPDATGSDDFIITVAGGDSGTDSQQVTVQLDARADAPQLGATHGQAVDFAASSEIIVENDGALDPGTESFTVEAWVNFDDLNGDTDVDMIVSKGNNSSSFGGWSLFVENGVLHARVNGSDDSTQRAAQSLDVSDLTGWAHVAMVIDRTNGEVRGYLDGSNANWTDGGGGASGNSIAGFGAIESATDMAIGASRLANNTTSGANGFEGRIDEVRLWSGARTEDQLQSYSQLRLNGPENGLIAAYDFEDANKLGLDVTGNGHDGVVGGTVTQDASGAPAGGFDIEEDAGSVALTGITVADPDTTGDITVVMEVERGTLTLSDSVSGGIGASGIVGNGTSKLILSGSAAAIGTTLGAVNGLLYAAAANASGLDRLQITANDGQGISTRSYDVTIDAVDDAVEAAGGMLQFDGVDDFAEVAEISELDGATGLTIEGWINTSVSAGTIVQLTGDDSIELSIDGTGKLELTGALGDGGRATSASAVNTGEWVHVAAVLEDGVATLYVNGEAAGSDAVSATISDPDLLIGKTSFGDHYTGALDELRLWSVARSEAEIQATYQRQLTGDESGLAAYYRFDERLIEELTDSSGNGHVARLGGVDRSSGDASPVHINDLNGGLRFDGAGEVTVANDAALSPASFTLETWVRAEAGDRSADQRLLVKPDGLNETTAYALSLSNGQPVFTVTGGVDGSETQTVNHGAAIDNGLWRHVAASFDGGTGLLSLYVDGRLSGTTTLTSALNTSSDDLLLGANGFIGDLAETRLWSTARSAQEIQDSYELAASGAESGLVALWRGVEDPDGGTVVHDLAGDHDGTAGSGVSLIDPMAPIEGPTGGVLEVEALEGRTVAGVASAEDVGGPVRFAISSAGAIATDGDWQQQSLAAGTLRLHTVTGEWVFEAAYDVTGPQTFEITAYGDDGRTDAQSVSVAVRDFDFDPQVQGGALSFDGASLVDVGRGVGDGLAITGDLTLEMWVNPSSLDGGRLLSFHGGAGDGEAENALYTLYVGASGQLAFSSETGEGTDHTIDFDGAALQTGAWRHVSVVRDTGAQELRLYIDGQLADAVDYAYTPTGGGDSRLVIGANTPDGGNYFTGFLDEIRVWSEARSASQIEGGWDRQIDNPTGEAALQAYWRGDDRDGFTLTDASANGNHAALGGVDLTDLAAQTLKFDGTDDVAARGSEVISSASGYTLEARFKWTGADSGADMLVAYNGELGFDGFGIGLDRVGTSSYQIAGFDGVGAHVAGPTVQSGRWYDVAVVNDGSYMRLYVDGALAASGAAPSSNGPNGRFTIGAAFDGEGESAFFAGEVDHVAVWGDVRTAGELAADAAGAISPAAADLAAYYRADAATDQSLTDLTGGTALSVDGARLVTDPSPALDGNWVAVTSDRNAAGTFQTYEIEGDGTYAVSGGSTLSGLSVLTEAGKGTLRIDPATGGWIFEPASGFAGEVSFTLSATGSLSGSDSETLTFRVLPPAGEQTPAGVAGARLAFDGGDVVTAPADAALAETGDLTVEMLVKPVSLPGTGQVRTLFTHTGEGAGDDANTLYSLTLDQNGDLIYDHQTTGGTPATHTFTAADLTAGDWAHLSLVRDAGASTVTLYKDGVSVGSYDYSMAGAPVGGSNGRLLIGAADDAGTDGFLGEMDEIRLFGDVRTTEEISYYQDVKLPSSSDNLLAYYRGETGADGLLADASGQGRDALLGSPGGADALAPRSIAPPSRAVSFDGTDDYIQVANDAALNPASFTVEAWFRTDATTTRQRIVTKVDTSGGLNAQYSLRLDDGKPVFSIWTDEGGGTGYPVEGPSAVNDGLWRHVAGSYDAAANQIRLYLDGELIGVEAVSGTLSTTTENLFIGSYSASNGAQLWTGDIADVRLWSEVRDGADIEASMNERLSGDESGLAAWWPLDDGAAGDTPATFADAVGANDGTAAGAPAIVDAAPQIGGGSVETLENQTASGVWDAASLVEGAVTYGIEGATVADGVATKTTAHGTASVDVATGAWSFAPSAGYAGTDGFTLTAVGATSGAVRQAMTVEIEETPAETRLGGEALSFDGGGMDAASAASVSGLSSSALTVEMWLNPAETANDGVYPISYAAGAEDDVFGIRLDDTAGPRFYLNFGGAGPDAGQYFDAGVDPLTPGEWAHLAVTWDQATGATAFYVNGVKTAHGTYQTGEAIATGGALVLGQEQDSVGGGFETTQAYPGLMDEVRVWSTVRSAEEIAAGFDRQVDPATSGLAAYYRADGYNGGTLADATANGNDASLSGVDVLAPPTSAADFDRTTADSHIAVSVGGAASALDLTDRVTVEAWIKPGDLSAAQAIFSKFDGMRGYEFGLDSSGRLTFAGGAGMMATGTATSTDALSVDAWAHVAAVYEAGTVRFFINGDSAGEAVLPNMMLQGEAIEQLGVNTTDALIGARDDAGVVREFDGAIGELRVWSDARSADEIFTYRDRAIADPAGEGELAGYWRLDDVANGAARDLAGSLDGIVQGAVTAGQGGAPISGSTITLVEGEGYTGRFLAEVGGEATYSLSGGTVEGAYSTLSLTEGVARIHQQTGVFSFTPASGFSGTAANLFTLQASGANGATQTAQLTAVVEAAPSLSVNAAGASLRFDDGDTVTIADAAANDVAAGQDFTLEAWVYRQGAGAQTLIEKGDVDGVGGGFSLELDVIGRPKFSLSDGSVTTSFVKGDLQGLPENGWSHIAVSVDRDGVASMYVDGASVATANLTSFSAQAFDSGDLVFGGDFDGLMDDVRLWSTARSADQIADAYQRQLSGGEADLAGYWRLDDAPDNGMADATGHNLDGTASGAEAVRSLGRAAEFGGDVTEAFTHASAFDPGAGDFSVSAWVRLDDLSTAQTLVGKGDPDGAGGWSIELDGSGSLIVSVGDGTKLLAQSIDVTGQEGWRHVGFTLDRGILGNDEIKGYLDGSNAGWTAAGDGSLLGLGLLGSSITSSAQFAVGAQHDGVSFSQPFDGAVDELRIYAAARSASDMAADMTSATADPAGVTDLIGYFGFEEASGNALDASAGGYDLTAGAGAQRSAASPTLEGTLFTVEEDQILSGLLQSDSSQSSPFTLGDGPDNGTVDLDAETGRWTYDPDPSYTGEDSFSFQATDASGNVTEKKITVTVEGAGGMS